MRWKTTLIPLLAVGALLVVVGMPRAAAAADDGPPRLTVRGQGVVSVRPDVAVLTMGASVRRETAAAAFEQSNTLIAALTQTLREQGIAERDIQTRQFNLSPEFGRAPENGAAPIVGWRSVNLLSIKVRDFTKIGAVIDSGARILGNDAQISGVLFSVEDTEAVARQARAAAIANARQQADQMAAAASVRIVRILSITETSAPPPPPQPFAAPTAGVALARGAEVSPGEQSITVSVEIVYEIG